MRFYKSKKGNYIFKSGNIKSKHILIGFAIFILIKILIKNLN